MGSNGGDETKHEGWGIAVVVGEDSGDEFQVHSGDDVVLVGLRKHHQLNGAKASTKY